MWSEIDVVSLRSEIRWGKYLVLISCWHEFETKELVVGEGKLPDGWDTEQAVSNLSGANPHCLLFFFSSFWVYSQIKLEKTFS